MDAARIPYLPTSDETLDGEETWMLDRLVRFPEQGFRIAHGGKTVAVLVHVHRFEEMADAIEAQAEGRP